MQPTTPPAVAASHTMGPHNPNTGADDHPLAGLPVAVCYRYGGYNHAGYNALAYANAAAVAARTGCPVATLLADYAAANYAVEITDFPGDIVLEVDLATLCPLA